jgi:hypothetical protein
LAPDILPLRRFAFADFRHGFHLAPAVSFATILCMESDIWFKALLVVLGGLPVVLIAVVLFMH